MILSFALWALIGVLSPFIARDFHLDPARTGMLVAIPVLGGALSRIPLGLAVDRVGPKITGLIAQLIVLIPLLGCWLLADSYHALLCFGLLLGVAGGSLAVALPLASHWYPAEQQGLVLGIAGAGNSGAVLAALFCPRLANHFGWHGVFLFALAPALITVTLFALFAKESPSQPPRSLSEYFHILRQRDTLAFCLLYSFTFGGFVGLSNMLTLFFVDQYSVSKITAGTFTALCVLSAGFLRPVGGTLADHLGGTRVLKVLFLLAVAAAIAISTLPPLHSVVPLLLLLMGVLGLANGSVFQLVPQRFQDEIGAATGIVGAAGGFGGFLLPNLLGSLKQVTGSFGPGFLAVACAGLILTAMLQIVQKRWQSGFLRTTGEGIREVPAFAEGD